MKRIIMHLAKKYAVKAVNDLLGTHTDDVRRISSVVDVWTIRLQKITEQLKRINSRVSDGILEDEEVSGSVAEIEKLIREF